MMKKIVVIACFICSSFLFSFFQPVAISPEKKIKEFYVRQFHLLHQQIERLHDDVLHNAGKEKVQFQFLAARLAYKQIEGIFEYYDELDVSQINGPAINFVEEEDPLAVHEPQGFQMIESFLYPDYDSSGKQELLRYVDKLSRLTEGLSKNADSFLPDKYLLDAAMEELYRVLSLGLTGFDSPSAQLSLLEARASLQGIRFIIEAYHEQMVKSSVRGYDRIMLLLDEASKTLDRNADFDRFDRMQFILQFLNPVTAWLGQAKIKTGYAENPARYSLIGKRNHLFAADNLRLDRYLFDDTVTQAKIDLGKKLFYDPALSKNGKRSCAGCHQPDHGFTDGIPRAIELDEHTSLLRNTPTLWNAALQRNLFYDSRQSSLFHLITEVLGNNKEMNGGSELAASGLSKIKSYKSLYHEAYPFADTAMQANLIVNAIAMYVRTLVSYNSRFDRYVRGDRTTMTANEVNGFNLFMGKAKCATCHYVPLFNGSKPPAYYFQESEVIGVPATADTNHASIDADEGRYNVIKQDFLKHSFKTPTLRNIALTAPYMHNGVFQTLEQVLEFYNKGGGKGLHIDMLNQSLPFDKLHLTASEEKNIILFLKSLTDTSMLNEGMATGRRYR